LDSADVFYLGELDTSTQTITGQLKSGGFYNLDFSKEKPVQVLNRPQHPHFFDYQQQEVLIKNKKTKKNIGGTLTYPNQSDNFTTIILLSDGGQQDRDFSNAEHKYFLVLADFLTKNGFAVLRTDDSGVGKSDSIKADMLTKDVLINAESMLAWAIQQPKLNKHKIGFLGIGEGGLVATMMAAKYKNIAFTILLSTFGLAVLESTQQQMSLQIYEQLNDLALSKKFATVQNVFLNFLTKKNYTKITETQVLDAMEKACANCSNEEKAMIGVEPNAAKFIAQTLRESHWLSAYLQLDINDYLPKVECPNLVIFGKKTKLLNIEAHNKAFLSAFGKQKTKLSTVEIFPDLNYFMQTCQTGALSENIELEETFSPKVAQFIIDWLKKL
jgi:uncharacterized protein